MKKKNEDKEKKLIKTKKAKQKTDPNLFLFSEAIDEEKTSQEPEVLDLSEVSKIDEHSEDLEVPSYLRKGNI